MPDNRPRVAWRWLRILLWAAALGSGLAGQYWLSVRYIPAWSAAAWAAAVVSFVLLYMLGRDARELPATAEVVGSPRLEWVLFALVFGVGVFFTVFRLHEVPPGLNHDAAFEGLYAIRILHGLPYTPYTAEAWGRETFTFYLRALSIWLMGPTALAVTVPSVVAGILILPFFYGWARLMFGARTGLMAMLFLGVSGWHLLFSRTGWRSDFQPLFMAITCFYFLRAMITAAAADFALSGIALAVTLNTYNGSRVFPLLFPIWLIGVVLQSWRLRGFVRHYGRGLLFMGLTFAVAIAPLAQYALHNWEVFQGRAHALAGVTSLSEALQTTALLFNFRGNGDDFLIGTPGLEYPAAVLLVFGVLWALLRIRDERAQFLLLGLAINLLPGLVSKPNLNRDIGTMPFIYLFVTLGAVFFAQQAQRLVPRIGRGLAVMLLVIGGTAALYATFAQYLGQQRRDVWGYYPETTVLGKYMKTLVPQYNIWVGGANFPRDALTYLSYTGQADPMQRNYVWLDDVSILLHSGFSAQPGKGLAFLLANEGPAVSVLHELERRYPQHESVDLHYPASGRVFAKALLVAHDGAVSLPVTAAAPAPALTAVAAPPPVASVSAQLEQPRGLAVTADGGVVVTDFGHHRIQQFGRDLQPLRQWGGQGTTPGLFNQPCAVAVSPGGDIAVADTWNQRVQLFSKDGTFVRQWEGSFFGPRGIATDAKHGVFVADTGNNRILRFSETGQRELEWGGKGSQPGQFIEPVGLSTDASGKVYVCDNGNGRLQVFTRDAQFLNMFPVPGWESKVYSEPNVTVDARGTIWVTVPGAKEIRQYDPQGKLLRTITGTTAADATFDTPMGIAFNPTTHELIVSDLAGRLVRIR